MILRSIILALSLIASPAMPASGAYAQDEQPGVSALPAEFDALAGRTWRAERAGESGELIVDVSRWDWILGGRALRITHSINDGVYGGQSTIYFDPEAGLHRFHYVTTAGFHTEGEVHFEDGAMVAVEEVRGHPSITRTRSTSRLVDGVLQLRSEYLENGTWSEGHSFDYVEAPGAEPVFEMVR